MNPVRTPIVQTLPSGRTITVAYGHDRESTLRLLDWLRARHPGRRYHVGRAIDLRDEVAA